MIKCTICQQNITYTSGNSYRIYDTVFISDCEHFVIAQTDDGKKIKLPICDDCYDDAE